MTSTKFPIMLCTFCYKSVTKTEDDGNPKNIELCNKFRKNLNSFVKPASLQVGVSSELVCCKDCKFLIEEFCEVYNQTKCLELQLQWKLETLMKVMKSADKVPSRVKALEQIFVGIKTVSQMSKESQLKLMKENSGSASGQTAYQLFRKLRQDIISQCFRSRSISQLQPRVVLKRLNQVERSISNTKSRQMSDIKTKANSFEFNVAIGWIMSFGAVVFLQSLYSDFRTEHIVDDGETTWFKNEKNHRNYLEEILGNEEDTKIIQPYSLSERNELCEDIEFEQCLLSEPDEDFVVESKFNVTQEAENDSSSVSSEENPAERIDLKLEHTSEVPTINSFENSSKYMEQQSFPCQQCSVTFISERSLSSHIKWRHRSPKRKVNKTKVEFSCYLCKTSYSSYQLFRRHKVSSGIHRFLERKKLDKISSSLKSIKKEQNSEVFSKFPVLVDNKEDNITPNNNVTNQNEINSKRFNLRLRKKKQCGSGSDNESNLNSDTNEKYLQSSDSSCSSSSHESNIEDDTKSSSFNYKTNKNEKKQYKSETSQLYRCVLDNCKLKQVLFYKNSKLDQDKKLHIRNQYKCYFCDKVEVNPISLSLHETEMHSAIPSTSSNIKHKDGIFYCARCPFETRIEGVYVKHFISIHLQECRAETKTTLLKCDICKKTFETLTGLEIHQKFHGIFGCLFCDVVKNYATDLALHEYKVHNPQIKTEDQHIKSSKFECSRCSKIFNHKSCYTKHFVNEHLGISTIQSNCSICQSECHNKSLKIHHLSNQYTAGMDPEKVLKCIKCPVYFRTDKQLTRHTEKRHKDPTKPALLIPKSAKCNTTFQKSLHLESRLDKEHSISNISSKFKCNKCSRYFVRELSLKRHVVQVHSRERSENLNDNIRIDHMCLLDKCKRRFKDKASLDLHQNLHKRGIYSCKFCAITVDSILKLSMHENVSHPNIKGNGNKDRLFYCPRCPYKHKSALKYQTHFAETHIGTIAKLSSALNEKLIGKYKCNFCEMETVSALKLGYHEADHVNKNAESDDGATPKIQCPRCPKSYKKMYYIKHYLKVHFDGLTKRKQNICSICHAKTVKLNMHYKMYHNTDDLEDPSKVYKCQAEEDTCKAYFTKYEHLLQHKKLQHPLSEWICEQCGKKYKTEKSLTMHKQCYHSNVLKNPELPFKCNVNSCTRGFNTEEELEVHKKRGHLEKKSSYCVADKIKCDQCNKSFFGKQRLKNHIRTIHSNRSYVCPQCGKQFRFKSHLKNHLERHKGPSGWKFQCSTCGQKLSSKGNLTNHMRTHTGERPYMCQYCGKDYSDQYHFKSHMVMWHQDMNYWPKKKETKSNLPNP